MMKLFIYATCHHCQNALPPITEAFASEPLSYLAFFSHQTVF